MRTIEEVKELIKQRMASLYHTSPSRVILRQLLEAIDAPPPCTHPSTHPKLIYWNGVVLAPSDLPSGWYSLKNYNNTASDRFTFCPDCGEKLND